MTDKELQTPPTEAEVIRLCDEFYNDSEIPPRCSGGIARRLAFQCDALLSQVAALSAERDAAHARGRLAGLDEAAEAVQARLAAVRASGQVVAAARAAIDRLREVNDVPR